MLTTVLMQKIRGQGGSSLAYICPGMTFIAVYHTEFIDLIRSRWSSSSGYLWCYPKHSGDHRRQTTISIGIILWYLLLMPLWTSIAKLGEHNMEEYNEKEDSLSPGVVKPKRVTVVVPATRSSHLNITSGDNTKIQMPRYPSDSAMNQEISNEEHSPLVKHSPQKTSYCSVDFNKMTRTSASSVGARFSVASTGTRLSAIEIETELQKDDPTWVDFYIAMFYVSIGVTAMTLGLASIIRKS
jgi:hypothetical protein